jgi:histidine ammonia-lyase
VTVVIDGRSLTVGDMIAVARAAAPVALAPAALDSMTASRRALERAVANGHRIYGTSTAAGALQRVDLGAAEARDFNRAMLMNCRVGLGAPAGHEIVRGTLLRLANNLARGVTGVRPELAELLVRALNEDWRPTVRMLGSVGQADLAPMAELMTQVLDIADFQLEAGEGMAVIDNNAFSTAIATFAFHDLERLAAALDVTAALEMEGYLANPSILHRILAERPYAGLAASADRLRALLDGSWIWRPEVPRNLQDPLTYRCIPQIHGALRDTLTFARGQLAVELNAAQSNPLVDVAADQVVTVGCFDILPLAAALDYVRIALAPVLTSANERMMKLLHTGYSGLPPGLATDADRGGDGFTEFGVAGQSLVAEARLLAAPVSFEMASVTQAEGIEDRTTMAPLAGRRVGEMVELGEMLAAMELVVAARAVDLRRGAELGAGTREAHRRVRACLPARLDGEPIPANIDRVIDLVKSGSLGDICR